MFRRSRFSVRPNVGTAGRTAATSQEVPSSSQESGETPTESSTPSASTETKPDVTPSEKVSAPGDGNDQNAEGASSSAAVQRRKRFSVKPKVVPGRPSTLSRTSKSPVKAVAETPIETLGADLDKPSPSIQTGITAAPQGLQSPRRRRCLEESKQPKVQPQPTPDSSEPSADPLPDKEQTNLPTDTGKQLESNSGSQVKEVPPRPPDKERLIPDREAIELSERAKTLVSKSRLSLSPSALSLRRLLNDPSDLQRLAKAQKLRELLREERHKEKKLKKTKPYLKEFSLDPTKMTMRDLIHYLPLSNPMTQSPDVAQENETVLPPEREQSLEIEQEPEPPSTREDEEEVAEEEEDDACMVPQVKVAEDGSLIIDEESLTVEVQRAKGPNPAQDGDPVFESGSMTTYSSFRKSSYSKPWSSEETDMFYLAVSMVGTDFTMICQLFPHRARSEIRNKFKKEERANSWRIDKAFNDRRKLDIEYFSKLLAKILEAQENRKKLKKLSKSNSPKKSKRKAKGKKKEKTLSDVEEDNEDDASEIPILEDEDEEEGEKENENLCNEEGSPVSKPKRQRKRKAKQAAVDEEPNDKQKKIGEKSNEQDEACVHEDPEEALQTASNMSEKDVNAAKDTAIKPAKLSRGRAPKPLLPLGRKWSKKLPPESTKAKDTASDKDDESLTDGASKEKVNQDSSPLREDGKTMSADALVSSDEEDVTAPAPRPTRYGRVPKPTKPLNYPAKEDAHTSASDTTPASPVNSAASAAKPKHKCTAKRARPSKQQSAQQSKKPKLVTLKPSRSEFSDDDEDEEQQEEEEEEECPGEDSTAPVFVPASLRSPPAVISEVEETMEELDILANMPDVLGLSQDVLCPDSSFVQAAEHCEHQLDLLVDVIDFLSAEHTEVTEDESYNEAAQTLLTIGNQAPLSAQNQTVVENHTVSAEETEILRDADQEENCDILKMFGHGDTETSDIIAAVEPHQSTADGGNAPMGSSADCSPQLDSSVEMREERGSRIEKPKSRPDTATAQKAEKSNTESEVSSAPEGTTLKIQECSLASSRNDNSSSKAKDTVTQETSGTAAFDQSHCFSDAQFEHSGEQATTDVSAFESADQSFCNDLSASETSDSVPVHKGSQHPAALITAVDNAPVIQKEEGEVASTSQIRRGRSLKAKPKPNLAQTTRTAHSRPRTTKATIEKEPSPPPAPQTHEDTLVEVEAEATSNTGPAAALIPTLDSGFAPTPTQELSTTEDRSTESGLDQSVSQNQVLTEASERDTGSTSGSMDEKMATCNETTDSSDKLAPSVRESHVPVSQKEESASTSQIRRGRCQKAKPKPNLALTSRTARSKPQTTKGTAEKEPSPAPVQTQEETIQAEPEATSKPSVTPTQEPSTAEDKGTALDGQVNLQIQNISETSNIGRGSSSGSTDEKVASCDAASVQESGDCPASSVTPEALALSQKEEKAVASTLPIRRGRAQKPIPNLASRTARSKPQTTKELQTTEKITAEADSLPICSTSLPIQTIDTALVSVQSFSALKCSEQFSKVKPDLESSTSTAQTKPLPEEISEPSDMDTATSWIADSLSPEGGTTDSKLSSCLATNVLPTESELTNSSKSSQKGLQNRRGRLINPKPNLRCSSRPQQPKQVQNAARAEADPGAQSEVAEPSVSLNPVSELQEPAEGAVESVRNQESFPSPAVSSLPVTQAVDNPSQSESTFGTEGTQSHPCLQLFPDLTSEQIPSDPNEPFFILSLSEIPVCSSGEVMDSAAGPLPYLPDGYAPIQLQSVPGESLAPQEDTSLSNVCMSTPVEESSEMSFLGVKHEGRDAAVYKDPAVENPEDPQDTVQPSTLPEAGENNATTEPNLTKKRIARTGRRAQVQVKPNITKKTQASKTAAGDTHQDSGLPGSSTQAEVSDAKTTVGSVDVCVGKQMVRKSPESRRPGEQTGTINTRGINTGTKKSGDYPSFLWDKNSSDLPCDRAASEGRKHSTSTPAASTSHTATPPALTQSAAKVSALQQSVESSPAEVEPTSVSQYFLSDIFTDVE